VLPDDQSDLEVDEADEAESDNPLEELFEDLKETLSSDDDSKTD